MRVRSSPMSPVATSCTPMSASSTPRRSSGRPPISSPSTSLSYASQARIRKPIAPKASPTPPNACSGRCRNRIVPTFVKHGRGWNPSASPMWVYRFEHVRETLDRLRDHDGDPYDGLIIEYVNPTTGGPGMPTMSFHMRMLRPGERTAEHRHTSTAVYCAVHGSGMTDIAGASFQWEENDVFGVACWS